MHTRAVKQFHRILSTARLQVSKWRLEHSLSKGTVSKRVWTFEIFALSALLIFMIFGENLHDVDSQDSKNAANQLSWQSAMWAIAAIALTTMADLPSSLNGYPDHLTFYLKANPVLCLANVSTTLLVLTPYGASASTMDQNIMQLATKKFSDRGFENLGHRPMRMILFIFGSLPQAVKLFACRGVVITQIIASCYLLDFINDELLLLFARYKTSHELLLPVAIANQAGIELEFMTQRTHTSGNETTQQTLPQMEMSDIQASHQASNCNDQTPQQTNTSDQRTPSQISVNNNQVFQQANMSNDQTSQQTSINGQQALLEANANDNQASQQTGTSDVEKFKTDLASLEQLLAMVARGVNQHQQMSVNSEDILKFRNILVGQFLAFLLRGNNEDHRASVNNDRISKIHPAFVEYGSSLLALCCNEYQEANVINDETSKVDRELLVCECIQFAYRFVKYEEASLSNNQISKTHPAFLKHDWVKFAYYFNAYCSFFILICIIELEKLTDRDHWISTGVFATNVLISEFCLARSSRLKQHQRVGNELGLLHWPMVATSCQIALLPILSTRPSAMSLARFACLVPFCAGHRLFPKGCERNADFPKIAYLFMAILNLVMYYRFAYDATKTFKPAWTECFG